MEVCLIGETTVVVTTGLAVELKDALGLAPKRDSFFSGMIGRSFIYCVPLLRTGARLSRNFDRLLSRDELILGLP